MIERANGRMTVPQIFIGKIHVGGSDDLHALEREASSIRCSPAKGNSSMSARRRPSRPR